MARRPARRVAPHLRSCPMHVRVHGVVAEVGARRVSISFVGLAGPSHSVALRGLRITRRRSTSLIQSCRSRTGKISCEGGMVRPRGNGLPGEGSAVSPLGAPWSTQVGVPCATDHRDRIACVRPGPPTCCYNVVSGPEVVASLVPFTGCGAGPAAIDGRYIPLGSAKGSVQVDAKPPIFPSVAPSNGRARR